MGSGKKQTVGYRYYMGLHLVMCRQADALLQIDMASKEAWRGYLPGGQGSINKPDLFGGDKREGGFSGVFDFMLGESTQPVNDYLSSVLGALVPAYRGSVSLVMRRPYVSANTARLPNMKFKLMNTSGIHRGWNPSKALIGVEKGTSSVYTNAIYVAWDVSIEMTTQQLEAGRSMLVDLVNSLSESGSYIHIQYFCANVTQGFNWHLVTPEDTDEVLDFLATVTFFPSDAGSTSNWSGAFVNVPVFFGLVPAVEESVSFGNGALINFLPNLIRRLISSESNDSGVRRTIIMLSVNDATPTTIEESSNLYLEPLGDYELYAYRFDNTDHTDLAQIDNTPADGVVTLDSNNPGTFNIGGVTSFIKWADMNPAHIIRCLWSDPMRGGIVDDSEFGDSFELEADRFYSEKFGLSPRFDQFQTVEQARLDVERHVDCISYRSRITNKIEIKAVRNDYDPVDLPVLDSSIVMDWSGLERSSPTETPNQLTVIYTKRENGETASVTRTNIAGVRRAGRVIPGEPVEYLSCTREDLAVQLCLRDLSVQNRPLLTGSLPLAYFPPNLDIGDPFIINEPKLQINNVVVRITEADEGDGVNNTVTVKIAEDEFALPSSDAIGPVEPAPSQPSQVALPCIFESVLEAPYYLLALEQSQSDLDNALNDEPDLGFIMALGVRATPIHRTLTLALDEGFGYEDRGEFEFSPAVATISALSADADDTVVTVPASPALELITANSLALIGNEIVRIDSMAPNGMDVDIAIGRGCLDTSPAEQPIGSYLVFLQQVDVLDAPSFVAPETADVKLLTNLESKRLSLFSAAINTVGFNSRAIRPYRPGALQLNGSFSNNQNVVDESDVVLTWAHRDRTLQTTLIPEDFTAGDIGPEIGVTYRVKAVALDENYNVLAEVTNSNVGTVTTYDWDDATVLPDGTNKILFTVSSEKGLYESWQPASIYFNVLFSPSSLTYDIVGPDVVLSWENLNSGSMAEDDIVIYRSTAPFDYSTLPTVLATIAAGSATYTDLAPASGDYYYAVVMRRDSRIAGGFTDIVTV